MRFLLLYIFVLTSSFNIYSQGCCSGGSGSPIAGGASQGVLADGQFEAASNFQYINSNKFMSGAVDTLPLFDNFNSRYLYSKIAYGVAKKLSVSAELGYFFNKSQIGKDKVDTITSSGIGDLILFPRYEIFNRCTEKKKIEITIGLGFKIPLGKHNDSTLVYTNPVTGRRIFTTSPPLVQPTNGSQDFIFYGFLYRGFPKYNFRIFANSIYIRKGWNSLGQKFGDYKSVSLFAGQTFFKTIDLTVQLRAEMVDVMESDKNIDMLALYNIDVRSTGSKKILLVPQISYTFKSLTLYGLYEFPLYQYVTGVQVVTQQQLSFGLTYRFFIKKQICETPVGDYSYICPMKCEGSESSGPGKCPVCGMKLENINKSTLR